MEVEEALRFFKLYEVWIYLILGLGGAYFTIKFIRAWDELRQSSFGLERESAQGRLNRAASVLVLIVFAAITEFALVSFAIPAIPGANPLLTPTLDLLATPTVTLEPGGAPDAALIPEPDSGNEQAETQSTCIPGQVMLTEPQDGSTVEGIVAIVGSANIPNLGYYKFEMARPNESNWLSIEARNNPVVDGELGNWNTTRLDPGVYLLRLVVTDNQGQALPPCMVQVNVVPEQNP
jgi:hypothetical protein